MVCPFSRKIVRSLSAQVIPHVVPSGKLHGQLSLLIRPVVQGWHVTSTLTNEAVIAFGAAHPTLFWEYYAALMERQEEYFDIPAEGLSIREIRDKLAQLAGEVLDKAQQDGKVKLGPLSKSVGEFRDRLALKSTPNGGYSVLYPTHPHPVPFPFG
jgi:hypothetical protein